MERAQCDRDLFVLVGVSALPRVGRGGRFLEFWRQGLLAYDAKHGIEWEWLAMDGALGKAPLGGERPVRIPLTELKRGEAIAPHRG